MGAALRSFWRRLTGTVLCTIAALLPFRARMAYAWLMSLGVRPPSEAMARFMRRPIRFWNVVLLGLVFLLAMPIARLLFAVGGGRRGLAPKPGSETYWVERVPAEEHDRRVEDPF